MDDEEYKRVAEIEFNRLRDMQEHSMKVQSEYGRWLVSSLLFLHGAAIGGLLFKTGNNGVPPYLSALWWFVGGIVLALAAGFAAWWNFTFAAQTYFKWADYRMLSDRAYWPKGEADPRIGWTLRVAVAGGLLSVACLIAGAGWVVSKWH
jgi:hypothetical protein